MALEIISKENQEEWSDQLSTTTDPSEVKNIINMVNLSIKKKDVLRATKLADLQDKIVNQMEERINKRPGEFSNDDLLKYLNSIQGILDKSDRTDDIPTVAVQNNTNINIQSDLSRDSKERIREALRAVLSQNLSDESNTIVDSIPVNEENTFNNEQL